MAAPSAALADGTEERTSPLVPAKGAVMAEKDRARMARAEVAAFPKRSMMLSSLLVCTTSEDTTFFLLVVLSTKRLLSSFGETWRKPA